MVSHPGCHRSGAPSSAAGAALPWSLSQSRRARVLGAAADRPPSGESAGCPAAAGAPDPSNPAGPGGAQHTRAEGERRVPSLLPSPPPSPGMTSPLDSDGSPRCGGGRSLVGPSAVQGSAMLFLFLSFGLGACVEPLSSSRFLLRFVPRSLAASQSREASSAINQQLPLRSPPPSLNCESGATPPAEGGGHFLGAVRERYTRAQQLRNSERLARLSQVHSGLSQYGAEYRRLKEAGDSANQACNAQVIHRPSNGWVSSRKPGESPLTTEYPRLRYNSYARASRTRAGRCSSLEVG